MAMEKLEGEMDIEEGTYAIEWIDENGDVHSQMHGNNLNDNEMNDKTIDDVIEIDDIIEEIHETDGQENETEYYVNMDNGMENIHSIHHDHYHHTIMPPNNPDQTAAENLIYMAQDGNVTIVENGHEDVHNINQSGNEIVQHFENDNGPYYECITEEVITEELITDDWVQEQGKERVQVVLQPTNLYNHVIVDDSEIPLPTVMDNTRPFPCDFCSRRFRKRGNLMNHMVAHKNDRPHICNLCGSKYFRRLDLINHLKVHAQVPEEIDNEMVNINNQTNSSTMSTLMQVKHNIRNSYVKRKDRKRQKKLPKVEKNTTIGFSHDDIKLSNVNNILHSTLHDYNLTSITDNSYNNNNNSSSNMMNNMNNFNQTTTTTTMLEEKHPITDPKRPFVCQSCGVSFAREKAYLSHLRLHGGDLQLECDSCSEMFWSVTLLREHQRLFHSIPPEQHEHQQPEQEHEQEQEYEDEHDHEQSQPERNPISDEYETNNETNDLYHEEQSESEDADDDDKDVDYFADINNIDEDSEDEDTKYGQYFCNICGMAFHRNNLLKRHVKTAHKQNNNVHVGVGGRRNRGDERNADQDDEEGGGGVVVGGAGGSEYNNGNDLNSKHCCNVCGQNFAEALELLAHAEIHARNEQYKCVLCGEKFLEESIIKKHISNVHENVITETTCRLCGKQCKDARSLIKHSWEHSKEKNHSCSKCGKTFHNKARLKRHMLSHRNKCVRCDVCDEEFADGRTLMNHRHSHTNVSGRQFPCKDCGKTFGSRSSQQIHMRIHTGERPYGCRFCWKAFADGGTLRKHERIHTGEKPYACPVCPRAFNQRVVLREHIRSHHSAPDAKSGTILCPYFCTVCEESFSQAAPLVQHLIEHSDTNTAMKRQPPVGPRKYKRRRKLKPHELERMRTLNPKTSDEDDFHINTSNDINITINHDEETNHEESCIVEPPNRRSTKNIKREKKISFSTTFDDHYSSSSFNHMNEKSLSDFEPLMQSPIKQIQNPMQIPLSPTTTITPPKYVYKKSSFKKRSNKEQKRKETEERQQQKLAEQYQQQQQNELYYSQIQHQQQQQSNYDYELLTTSQSSIASNQLLPMQILAPPPPPPRPPPPPPPPLLTTPQYGSQQQLLSKPRMIHTQKTRVTVEDGKRKTRTLITRTDSHGDGNNMKKSGTRKRGRRPGSKQKTPTKKALKAAATAAAAAAAAALIASHSASPLPFDDTKPKSKKKGTKSKGLGKTNKKNQINNIVKTEKYEPLLPSSSSYTNFTGMPATGGGDEEYILSDNIDKSITTSFIGNLENRRTSKRISNRYDRYNNDNKIKYPTQQSPSSSSLLQSVTNDFNDHRYNIDSKINSNTMLLDGGNENEIDNGLNANDDNDDDDDDDEEEDEDDDDDNEEDDDDEDGDNENDDENENENNNNNNNEDDEDEDENDADNDNDLINDEYNITIKEEGIKTEYNEIFRCEMCAAVFNDRHQLLLHVPIHI